MTTMYQDKQPHLTDARNQAEIDKILPLLELDPNAQILDVGCGVGRWADAIPCNVAGYLGIDFSEGLVQIARSRNQKSSFIFETMSVCDFGKYFRSHKLKPFNRLIAAGILIYLNDSDVKELFRLFSEILVPGAVVYMREPVGIRERLTLKDFFSEELNHDYHTIYRTAEEYRLMMEENAPAFSILQSGFLFDSPGLMTLKGIGEAKAADIIRYREEQGPFQTVEEVMNISGIKEAAFEKIKNDITV